MDPGRQQNEEAEDFSKLSVARLKRRLKRVGRGGLARTDRKAELVERLTRHAEFEAAGGEGRATVSVVGTATAAKVLPKAKRARTCKSND
jgi:hypothetical protein